MTLIRAWNCVLERAGIDRVPFHTTRHTAATLMLAAGVSPRVAQDRLGHSTVSMTLDRYSHLTEAMGDGVALAVDSILDASAPSRDSVSKPRDRHDQAPI